MDTTPHYFINSGTLYNRAVTRQMKLPIVIGEIGVNHNGDLRLAKELMMMAASCGIPIVKFQKRDVESSTPLSLCNVLRPSIWDDGEMITHLEHRQKMEFGWAEYDEINTFASDIGLNWFISVWDVPSLEFMRRYNPHYIKIPSALITDRNLLQRATTFVVERGGQLIISSGMSSLEEIDTALEVIEKAGIVRPILFHCHSGYPADDAELNLSLIPLYKKSHRL